MRKKVGIIKRLFCLLLIFLLSINSFAAIVSDNDGSAFITKAEFDALKNSFQSQIDNYNTSIDSKIDGAIASYLAGIKISRTESQNTLFAAYNPSGTFYDIYGDGDLQWKEGHCYQHLTLSLCDERKYNQNYAGNSAAITLSNIDATIQPFTERLGSIEKNGSTYSFLFTGTTSSRISIFGGANYKQNENIEISENMQNNYNVRFDGNTSASNKIDLIGEDFPGIYCVWIARNYAHSYESDTPIWGSDGNPSKIYMCAPMGGVGFADSLRYFGNKYTDKYYVVQSNNGGAFRPNGFGGSSTTFNPKAGFKVYMSDVTFSRSQTKLISSGFYTTGKDTNRMRFTDTMNTAWCNDTDITGHSYPDAWTTMPANNTILKCEHGEPSVCGKSWIFDKCKLNYTGITVNKWSIIDKTQWPLVDMELAVAAYVSSVDKDVLVGNDRVANGWPSNLRKANGLSEVWPYPGFTTKVTNYNGIITSEGASAYMFMDQTNSSKINSSRTRKDSKGTNYLDVTTGIPIVSTNQEESYEYEVTNPDTTNTMVVCLSDGPIYTYSNTGSNWLQVTATGVGVSTTNSTFVNIQPGKTATIKFNAPNTNTVVFLSFSKRPASGLPDFKPINKAQLSTTLMVIKE